MPFVDKNCISLCSLWPLWWKIGFNLWRMCLNLRLTGKVPEEGCKGEPGTVRVSSANKNLFPATCRRLPTGRDPTARRWSPERRTQEYRYGERRSQVFLHSLHVLHGEVYLYFLRVLCVLCGKTVLVFFREFSCLSWLKCILKFPLVAMPR